MLCPLGRRATPRTSRSGTFQIPSRASAQTPADALVTCALEPWADIGLRSAPSMLLSGRCLVGNRSHRFRAEIASQHGAGHEARIGMAEGLLDGLERHIGKGPAVAQIFHVAPAFAIEWMEQRIVLAIKLQRFDPDALAQRQVERRGRLDPSPADMEVGVGVPDEDVGLDALV